MYFPIILGTAREGRQSEIVATYMQQRVVAAGHSTELLDVRDYHLPATDASGKPAIAQQYRAKVTAADGLIIVSPEYNHSFPGELKMMLDMAFLEYDKKPIALCGVSNGPWGGTRMIEQMNQYCTTVHALPTSEPLMFPKVQELFNAQGEMQDVSYTEKVKKFFDRLTDYATMVKK